MDPNVTNEEGATALMAAAANGHASVLMLLLADGRVNPNVTNEEGGTALTEAKTDSIKAILRADPRVIDPERESRGNKPKLMLML